MTAANVPNSDPFTLHLPIELPELSPRAAKALLELVDALADVELDDDSEAAV